MKRTLILLTTSLIFCGGIGFADTGSKTYSTSTTKDKETKKGKKFALQTATVLTEKINNNLEEAKMPLNTFQVKSVVLKDEIKNTVGGQEQRTYKFIFKIKYVEDYSTSQRKGSTEKGNGSVLFVVDAAGNWEAEELQFSFD